MCLLPWPPDCYSETEAEDPDDESPRHGSDSVSAPGDTLGTEGQFLVSPPAPSLPQPRKKVQNTPEKAQLSPASSPQGSPRPCSPMGRCLGGQLSPCHFVSLPFSSGCAVIQAGVCLSVNPLRMKRACRKGGEEFVLRAQSDREKGNVFKLKRVGLDCTLEG